MKHILIFKPWAPAVKRERDFRVKDQDGCFSRTSKRTSASRSKEIFKYKQLQFISMSKQAHNSS